MRMNLNLFCYSLSQWYSQFWPYGPDEWCGAGLQTLCCPQALGAGLFLPSWDWAPEPHAASHCAHTPELGSVLCLTPDLVYRVMVYRAPHRSMRRSAGQMTLCQGLDLVHRLRVVYPWLNPNALCSSFCTRKNNTFWSS